MAATLRTAAAYSRGRYRGGPGSGRRLGADLRLCHAAAGLAQPHHRLRHLQGDEGERRHERAGAADRRRQRHHPDGRARRGRDRHHQHHGGAGRLRRRPEGFAHHHRRPCAAHAVLRAQGLRHAHDCRSQRQARDDGLFRHAQYRQDRPAPCWPPPASPRPTSRSVLVPNVVRSADDFMAGNSDMFYFAFGGPKVSEADATVGGIRVARHGREGHARRPQDHEVGLCHPRSRRARSSSASRSR